MKTRSGSQLEEVYREHGPRLQRALLLFSGSREVAEDAVAEAFAQALRRGGEIRALAPWVWRTAFRLCAGELKERARMRAVVGDEGYEMPSPMIDLSRALQRLSPKQRGSVILHHYCGYSAKEVAAILGSTGPAVMVHLSQGRKHLRQLLGGEDHG